jgi:hypothetical protein
VALVYRAIDQFGQIIDVFHLHFTPTGSSWINYPTSALLHAV